MSQRKTKQLTIIAIFAALSSLLYLFPKLPLPIFPSFLEINFSMLPILIATFIYGSKGGLLCILLRFIVKMITISSSTIYVGEIADLIISSLVVIVISIFKYKTTLMRYLMGILTWVLVSVIANVSFLVPMYIKLFFQGDVNQFILACEIIPNINIYNYMLNYVIFAVIPFNLLLSSIIMLITRLTYNRLKDFLNTL